MFQLTAARRRLVVHCTIWVKLRMFQLTAARRRLGYWDVGSLPAIPFQLTAARRRLAYDPLNLDFLADVSTHSRAKAAGNLAQGRPDVSPVSTHSRAKAAGSLYQGIPLLMSVFQLTAARRRLAVLFIVG